MISIFLPIPPFLTPWSSFLTLLVSSDNWLYHSWPYGASKWRKKLVKLKNMSYLLNYQTYDIYFCSYTPIFTPWSSLLTLLVGSDNWLYHIWPYGASKWRKKWVKLENMSYLLNYYTYNIYFCSYTPIFDPVEFISGTFSCVR